MTLPERIMRKTVEEQRSTLVDTPCWIWQGFLDPAGYGRAWDGEQCRPAHRVTFKMAGGHIPEGWTVDHLCMEHSCVRPSHLEAVTLRAMAITHAVCRFGHELTGVRTRRGSTSRYCKTCQARMQREARARKKVAA